MARTSRAGKADVVRHDNTKVFVWIKLSPNGERDCAYMLPASRYKTFFRGYEARHILGAPLIEIYGLFRAYRLTAIGAQELAVVDPERSTGRPYRLLKMFVTDQSDNALYFDLPKHEIAALAYSGYVHSQVEGQPIAPLRFTIYGDVIVETVQMWTQFRISGRAYQDHHREIYDYLKHHHGSVVSDYKNRMDLWIIDRPHIAFIEGLVLNASVAA